MAAAMVWSWRTASVCLLVISGVPAYEEYHHWGIDPGTGNTGLLGRWLLRQSATCDAALI
jgi:hypothetical protein